MLKQWLHRLFVCSFSTHIRERDNETGKMRWRCVD